MYVVYRADVVVVILRGSSPYLPGAESVLNYNPAYISVFLMSGSYIVNIILE